ncbi:MAG: hypothetical protein R3D85_15385 [Paracoccaceae bacterium]
MPRGTLAPQAAGAFTAISSGASSRAETIAYEDFVNLGGEHGARRPARCARKARAMSSRTAMLDALPVQHLTGDP